MTITIEPLGGLGNQLFVYALGRTLSDHLNTDLRVDLWKFHKYHWHRYELDSFQSRITCTYASKLRETIGHRWRLIPQTLAKCGVKQLPIGGRLLTERYNTFEPSILRAKDGSRLTGYFQSWRYFEPTASEVINEVRSLVKPSQWFTETSAALSEIGNWTAIHVRLGNYRFLPKMGILDETYYQYGIRLIDKIYGNLPVIVFSDQPDLASKMQCFQGERFQYLKSPTDSRPIEILLLMSQATAKVIGNSTFSWWAGFVGDGPGKAVVAPRPWLASREYNERDLFPPHWFTVGY